MTLSHLDAPPSADTEGTGLWFSGTLDRDITRWCACRRPGFPGIDDSALGECAMAGIFGRGRHRHRDVDRRLLRGRGVAAGGGVAAIHSVGPAHAGVGEAASQHRSGSPDRRRGGRGCRRGPLLGILPA